MQLGTLEGGGGHLARAAGFALIAGFLAACSGDRSTGYQGYVEGEYVHVASPVGGRLERLLVERGQTVEAKAALFELEADEETAAKQQADEQLNAAQAQLADLKVGKRKPELAVAQAQLAQAIAAEEQAARQLKRDEAQFEAGGIARAQLDDSRANRDDPGRAGARALRPARRVAAARARRPDPRAERPGCGGPRRIEPVGLAARSEARRGDPGRARHRHAVPGRRVGAGRQPGGAPAAAEEREGALLRAGSRGRRPQAGPQRQRPLRRLRRRACPPW